jgi:hypothetical protein
LKSLLGEQRLAEVSLLWRLREGNERQIATEGDPPAVLAPPGAKSAGWNLPSGELRNFSLRYQNSKFKISPESSRIRLTLFSKKDGANLQQFLNKVISSISDDIV